MWQPHPKSRLFNQHLRTQGPRNTATMPSDAFRLTSSADLSPSDDRGHIVVLTSQATTVQARYEHNRGGSMTATSRRSQLAFCLITCTTHDPARLAFAQFDELPSSNHQNQPHVNPARDA